MKGIFSRCRILDWKLSFVLLQSFKLIFHCFPKSLLRMSPLYVMHLFSDCFSDIITVFVFYQFYIDVLRCGFPGLYSTWNSLSILSLWVDQIKSNFGQYFFKYFFYPVLFSHFLGFQLQVCWASWHFSGVIKALSFPPQSFSVNCACVISINLPSRSTNPFFCIAEFALNLWWIFYYK